MKLKAPKQEDAAIDMAPMIDMVFLLLIFFMVASQVVTDKQEVELPVAGNTKVPDDITGRAVYTVGPDGTIYDGKTPVSKDEFKAEIAEDLKENPGLRVYLRADGNVPYGQTRKVMAACAEVGAIDIIFATFGESE